MVSTFSILCEGKRYRVKATPMQTLQVLLDQVASQLAPPPPTPSACSLLLDGKPADLTTPVRFANLTPTSKLEVNTGRSSRLGVREQGPSAASRDAASASAPPAGRTEPQRPAAHHQPASAPQHSTPLPPAHPHPSAASLPPPQQQPSHATQEWPRPPPDAPAQRADPFPPVGLSAATVAAERAVRSRSSADIPADSSAAPMEWSASGPGPSLASASEQQPAGLAARVSERDPTPSQPVSQDLARLGLDRNVAVFTRGDLEATSAAPGAEEVPDSFFEFGLEDYAAVMQGYSQSKARAEAGLRTAKLRQQEEASKASRFPHTTIRVVFPDSHILQMEFGSQDTVGAVKASLARCLLPEVAASAWHIYTTPPKQILSKDEATLYQAQLCPAAKLYFGCSRPGGPFLRPEVLAKLAPPPQAVPSGGEGKEAEEKPGPSRSRVEPVKAPRQSNGAQAPDGKKLPKWMKLSRK